MELAWHGVQKPGAACKSFSWPCITESGADEASVAWQRPSKAVVFLAHLVNIL